MAKNKQPNVLFIMTDQFRADGLGESSFSKTPHLNALAKTGTLFTSCYANAPVCIPSRFSLATGQSISSLGINDNLGVDLNPHQTYWTNKIKDSGYQTAVIGKTHLHRHVGDLREREHLIKSYGFDFIDEIGGPRASMNVQSNMTDLWQSKGYLKGYIKDYEERFANKPFVARPSVLPSELYADNYVGSVAVDYLNQVNQDKPWFCWVSFGGPHEPWDAPHEYCNRYIGEQIPAPIPFNQKQLDLLPKESLHFRKLQQSPKISSREIDELRINYAANISLIDDRIGDIIETLESRDLLDNTLIVFTSDHGEMNGDHGLIYKNVLYEQAVKVPLIVRLAKNSKTESRSNQSDALVQLADLGPTILSLIGVNKLNSECLYAESFSELLTNNQIKHRSYIFSEVAGDIMVSDGKWKLVVNAELQPYILFDLSADPAEQYNLINNKLTWFVKRRLLRQIKQFINQQTAIRLCQHG